MPTLQYVANVDRMTVSLSVGYVAASGTMVLTLNDGAKLPTVGDFWLVTTTGTYQAFKVTARAGDTLTVVGGQDGTTDANLAIGQALEWNLTAGSLDSLRASLCRTMTWAAFAALGATDYKNGDRIIITDSVYEVVRQAGAWVYLFQGQVVTPPPTAGRTWVNQGASTLTDVAGITRYELVYTDGQDYFHGTTVAAPAAPYTLTTKLVMGWADTAFAFKGAGANDAICLMEFGFGDGTKLVPFTFGFSSSNPPGALVGTAKLATYIDAAPVYYKVVVAMTPQRFFTVRDVVHLRIGNDGTNLNFYYSLEGVHWVLFDARAVADYLTSVSTIVLGCRTFQSGVQFSVVDWTFA